MTPLWSGIQLGYNWDTIYHKLGYRLGYRLGYSWDTDWDTAGIQLGYSHMSRYSFVRHNRIQSGLSLARVIGISFDDLTQESVTTAVKAARESLEEGSELANLEEKAAELTQWLQSH